MVAGTILSPEPPCCKITSANQKQNYGKFHRPRLRQVGTVVFVAESVVLVHSSRVIDGGGTASQINASGFLFFFLFFFASFPNSFPRKFYPSC